jgi:hypothetical protein
MPISRETRADKRKPYRVDGVPRPRRLSGEQLGRLEGRVCAANRVRVHTIDGKRRFAAIADKRCKVIRHVIREVGWRGRNRLYISQIAGECDTTDDTVLRSLADAEAWGWLRRHPEYRTAPDGTRQRDASTFELLSGEPQGADGSCTTESILPFWRRRQALAERRRDAREPALLIVEVAGAPSDPERARAVMEKCGW